MWFLLGYVIYLWFAVAVGWVPAAFGATGVAFMYGGLFARTLAQVMLSSSSPVVSRYPPPATPGAPGEPAWPQYFFGQAFEDLRYVLRHAFDRSRDQFRRLAREINRRAFPAKTYSTQPAWRWPLGVLAWVALITGTLGGAALVGAVGLIEIAIVLVAQGAALALIYLLRGVDSALLQLKHIRIHCPTCRRRVPYPAYDCPKRCGRRHRDIRPGRYGVTRRTCACGAKIPTLLLLGSDRLDAYCPYCRNGMHEGAGAAAEIILPVFGATAAGKTRLLLTSVAALEELTSQSGGSLQFADKQTRKRIEDLKPALALGQNTRATSIASPPRAYSLQVAPTRGAKRFIHLFDAGGETFTSTERVQELRDLEAARSYLFVIDPLSLEGFWNRLSAREQSRLAPLRTVTQPVDLVFYQTTNWLQEVGVKTMRARLAVAISKADLVRQTSVLNGVGNNSTAIAAWLEDTLELRNLVQAMRSRFGEVHFFFTAAVLDGAAAVDRTIVSMTEWVLSGEGLLLR
jgi:hypothetical protein